MLKSIIAFSRSLNYVDKAELKDYDRDTEGLDLISYLLVDAS